MPMIELTRLIDKGPVLMRLSDIIEVSPTDDHNTEILRCIAGEIFSDIVSEDFQAIKIMLRAAGKLEKK